MTKESRLDPRAAVIDEVCPAGEPWMKVIRKGQVLRILDLEGNQAVDTLFYNAHEPEERYSAVDTIQRQANLYLTAGTQLISTEGNVLLTIVADTCGRHDTLGGACAQESNTVRYALDKRFMHACRDNFVSAIQHEHEHGLGKRDITFGDRSLRFSDRYGLITHETLRPLEIRLGQSSLRFESG